MNLERRLAEALILRHPERAATALELIPLEEATLVLSRLPAKEIAPVVQRMSLQFASAVLECLEAHLLADVVEDLPLDVSARLLRRLPPVRIEEALEDIGQPLGAALRSLLRFPEDSAGALMDPEALALPEGLTSKEAWERIRRTPEAARYNVYVVDTAQRLVGVVNLRELMVASPSARLADFMVRDPLRLDARSDRAAVLAHPGWREVHSLPVVDEDDCYLGAVRYRARRALEVELLEGHPGDGSASEALGRLFATGAVGVLDAISAAPALRRSQ